MQSHVHDVYTLLLDSYCTLFVLRHDILGSVMQELWDKLR